MTWRIMRMELVTGIRFLPLKKYIQKQPRWVCWISLSVDCLSHLRTKLESVLWTYCNLGLLQVNAQGCRDFVYFTSLVPRTAFGTHLVLEKYLLNEWMVVRGMDLMIPESLFCSLEPQLETIAEGMALRFLLVQEDFQTWEGRAALWLSAAWEMVASWCI